MRAVIVGDIHLADRPPSMRVEGYAQQILDKLTWIVDFANHGLDPWDPLILLGDVFHIKGPSRNSHWLVQATAKVLEGYHGNVLIVPGNHDLTNDRLESIPSQPLGTLALSPNITLLDGYREIEGPDGDLDAVYGIPYLDSFDTFKERLEEAAIIGTEDIGTEVDLILTHASIFPPGEEPPYEHMPAADLATGIPLAYGHIHDPHGFYKVGETWFCNNGAISRGSLHEQTVKRKPRVTIFDSALTYSEEGPFRSVDVPHLPAEEVFRLSEHEAQKQKQTRLDDFLSSLTSVSLTALSVEHVLEHARQSEVLTPEAKTELQEILESVQG